MTEQRDFQHAFLRNFNELKITFFPESLNLAIEEYSISFSERSFGWDYAWLLASTLLLSASSRLGSTRFRIAIMNHAATICGPRRSGGGAIATKKSNSWAQSIANCRSLVPK